MMSVCGGGCGTLVPKGSGPCPPCAAKREQVRALRRGRTAERDYGAEHQRTRRHWQQLMDQGQAVPCWRCGLPVDPKHWDLGHRDGLPSSPEHPTCNRSAGGRAAHNSQTN